MKKALKEIAKGQQFNYGGVNWIALDHFSYNETTFALAADIIGEMAFNDDEDEERGNLNDWRTSSIKEYLNGEFLEEMIENGAAGDAFRDMEIDLTSDDGMTDYGTDTAKIALLTADQYRKYRKHIPNVSAWWWLVTPYSCNASYSNYARNVYTDGSLSNDGAYNGHCGARPACLLSSDIKVEVEGYEEPNDTPKSAVNIYESAIHEWGDTAQIDMAIEEMAELTKALLHARRGRESNVAEEIADVRIMLAQLEIIFRNSDEVEKFKQAKIDRLAARLFGE